MTERYPSTFTDVASRGAASFSAHPIAGERCWREQKQSGRLGPERAGAGTGNHRDRRAQRGHQRQGNSAQQIPALRDLAGYKSA